jgi:hypothetical protein
MWKKRRSRNRTLEDEEGHNTEDKTVKEEWEEEK